MKLSQIELLTDENISPKTVVCLRHLEIDVLDTKEQQWSGTSDEVLLARAHQEHRFIWIRIRHCIHEHE